MLKLLIVVPTYYPATIYGGPTFSIHAAASELCRSGLKVTVYSTDANGHEGLAVTLDTAISFEKNYAVYYFKEQIRNRFSFMFSRRIFRLKQYDVVHLQDIFSIYSLLTLVSAIINRKKLIISPRGVLSEWSLKSSNHLLKCAYLFFLFKPLAKFANCTYHATSDFEKKDISQILNTDSIYTIPNFLLPNSTELYVYDKNERVATEKASKIPKPVCFGAIGRLHKKKCFDIAIRAFYHADIKNSILLIAGPDEGELKSLKELSRKLCVENRVFFLGEVTGQKKAEFFNEISYLLFPTHSENFGNSCLEALYNGIPVIASKNAPWETLNLYEAGLCVNNDFESFSEAIKMLVSKNYDKLRENAILLSKNFQKTTIIRQFIEMYSATKA